MWTSTIRTSNRFNLENHNNNTTQCSQFCVFYPGIRRHNFESCERKEIIIELGKDRVLWFDDCSNLIELVADWKGIVLKIEKQ